MFVLLCFQMLFGQKKEVLKIDLPKEYKWKVETKEENSKTDVVEAVPLQGGREDRSIVFILVLKTQNCMM